MFLQLRCAARRSAFVIVSVSNDGCVCCFGDAGCSPG